MLKENHVLGYNQAVDTAPSSSPRWFTSGDEIFPAMLAAIDLATEAVCFETYIFADCRLSERFRSGLVAAAERGVKVRVLVDALGSYELPDYFWHPLQSAGGEVRVFNPLSVGRLGIRNHRKLLACDSRVAFIGGFNISTEYEGDGVNRGWCDVGLRVYGALAAQLEASFERLFELADFRHRPFARLRKSNVKKTLVGESEQLLLSGPGRGANPLHRSLRRDLVFAVRGRLDASDVRVRVVVAYFLPGWRLRRSLQRIARRGGLVQLILPGKSDVALARLAGRSLYGMMMRAGIEIYEYQPQILHAKLFIINQAVYAGSANLDMRSLRLNYELMVRFESNEATTRANAVFDEMLAHSVRIERQAWRKSRTLLTRWKEKWANFLLARVDPYISLRQWDSVPE